MVSRKVVVTGCRGQLGVDLVRCLSSEFDVCGIDIDDCDIRNQAAVLDTVSRFQPDYVLHAAAYTDVDGCESNQDAAMAVNAQGTENVAAACRACGARMVYYSTDYVFDGEATAPYAETAEPAPQTVYGRSKLEGERRVQAILEDYVILRIAWLYGFSGGNFVKTMIELGQQQVRAVARGESVSPLRVVDDQIGNPTWTREIAAQTGLVLTSRLQGVAHCVAQGETSRFGLAVDIYDILGLGVRVRPCPSDEYPAPAPRPRRSTLHNKRLIEAGMNTMRPYREALEDFLRRSREVEPSWPSA